MTSDRINLSIIVHCLHSWHPSKCSLHPTGFDPPSILDGSLFSGRCISALSNIHLLSSNSDRRAMVATYPTYVGALLLQRWELFSFITGISAHLALFRRGEWDMSTMPLCYSYIAFFFAMLLGSFYSTLQDDHPSFFSLVITGLWACYIALSHLLGVFGSMSMYRLYFHRLSSFPGPTLAGLSGFYMFQLTRKRWHRFQEVQRLHKRYGDFVRVGK